MVMVGTRRARTQPDRTLAAACPVKRDRSPTWRGWEPGHRQFPRAARRWYGTCGCPDPCTRAKDLSFWWAAAAPRQAASFVQAELGAMPGAVATRSKSILAPPVSTARRRAGARGRSGLVAVCGRCRRWRQVEFIDLADQIDAHWPSPPGPGRASRGKRSRIG